MQRGGYHAAGFHYQGALLSFGTRVHDREWEDARSKGAEMFKTAGYFEVYDGRHGSYPSYRAPTMVVRCFREDGKQLVLDEPSPTQLLRKMSGFLKGTDVPSDELGLLHEEETEISKLGFSICPSMENPRSRCTYDKDYWSQRPGGYTGRLLGELPNKIRKLDRAATDLHDSKKTSIGTQEVLWYSNWFNYYSGYAAALRSSGTDTKTVVDRCAEELRRRMGGRAREYMIEWRGVLSSFLNKPNNLSEHERHDYRLVLKAADSFMRILPKTVYRKEPST